MRGRWGGWFRVYEDFVDDPKFLKISESSQLILVKIWAISSKFGGTIPNFEELRIKLRVHKDRLTKALAELQDAGLIDCTETGLRPHNWDKRQYKNDLSTERVKRFRKRRETVSRNGHETPPDTDSDTETEGSPLTPRPMKRYSGKQTHVRHAANPDGKTVSDCLHEMLDKIRDDESGDDDRLLPEGRCH